MLFQFLTKYNLESGARRCKVCEDLFKTQERVDCTAHGDIIETFCIKCWKKEVYK